MKQYLIIILLTFLGINIYAQERFYNLYEGWRVTKIFCTSEDYLLVGVQVHPSTDANIPQFNLIASDGTLLESFTYHNDSIDGLNGRLANSYRVSGDTIIFVGAIVDYNKSYSLIPVLVKYNFLTKEVHNIIAYNYVENYNSINYILDSLDNKYLIVGDYHYEDYNSYPILVFTNENGDTLSTKRYEFLPTNPIRRRVFPYQLLKLPDGGFLMSCQDEIGYYNYHGEVQRTCFLRLDSQGDELWRRYTTTQDTITFHPFAALMPDGDYLIAWSDPWLAESMNSNTCIWLARMTDDGVIYGKKKISEDITDMSFEIKTQFINDCYKDDDGNVYFAGTQQGIPYAGFLLKVDSQGNAKWFREYECFPENDATYSTTKIYGLTPTADGGFIMGGEYQSDPGTMFPGGIQQGLVIKVDSMGCLEEGCGETNIRHAINALNAEIYPNPASEKITITLAKQINNAKIKIYDAKACLWVNEEYENSEMDVSQLPAGIYTVNIWAEGKFYVGKFVKE